MEYFWKENKRFVVAVGGALVFLLLYNSFVLGPIKKGAADAERDRAKAKSDIERRMQQGVPNDDGLVVGRKDRDQNRKLLGQMTPEVVFTIPDRFQKPKKGNIKSFYDDLKIELTKSLQEKAVAAKVSMPQSLGLPDDISDDTALEVLSRMAVVDRMVTLAVDSDIEKIELVDGQYGVERDDRGPAKKSQFLTKFSVFLKMSGKAESVLRVVHGAQKKGSYLAVTQFEISRPDATKDLFEASMAVALLRVDDKAALEAK